MHQAEVMGARQQQDTWLNRQTNKHRDKDTMASAQQHISVTSEHNDLESILWWKPSGVAWKRLLQPLCCLLLPVEISAAAAQQSREAEVLSSNANKSFSILQGCFHKAR